jgi:hypothetical protein
LVTTLEQVFRDEWGRVLASLIGFLGDFDLAEEAAQEAFAIAADRWSRDEVPGNPRAWLQDPSRWNTEQIAAGRAELDRVLALCGRGPYVLQAAIASLHAEMPCDWAQIAALYGELAQLTGSPVVELNRAIAVGRDRRAWGGPAHRRPTRPRRLPLPALDPVPNSCDASAHRRGTRRLPACQAGHRRRRRTTVPRTPAGRAGSGELNVTPATDDY